MKIVFSGVHCDLKEQMCKVWWASTHKDVLYSAELSIPTKMKDAAEERKKEIELGEMLADSVLNLEWMEGE